MADNESLFIHWDNADKSLWERISKFEDAQRVESLIITSAAEFHSVFIRKLDGSDTEGDSGSRGYKFISNHDRREFERVHSELQKDPHNRRVIAVRTKGNIPLAMVYLVARSVPDYVAHLSYERTRARKKVGKDEQRLMKFVEISEESDAANGRYVLPLHNKSSDQSKELKKKLSGHTFFGYNSPPTAILPTSDETTQLNRMGSLKSVKGIVSVESIQYSYTYAAMLCLYKGLMISPNTVFVAPVVPDRDESGQFFFPSYASFLHSSLSFAGPFALGYKYKDTKSNKVSFLRTTIRRRVRKDSDDTDNVDTSKKDEKKRPTQRFLIRFFGLSNTEVEDFFTNVKFDEKNPTNVKHEKRNSVDEQGNPIVEELEDSDEFEDEISFKDPAVNENDNRVSDFENAEMFPPESPEIKQEQNLTSAEEAFRSQLIEHEDEDDEASHEDVEDPELQVIRKQAEHPKIVQVPNDEIEALNKASASVGKATPVDSIVPDERSVFGASRPMVTPTAPSSTDVDALIHAIDRNTDLPPVPKPVADPTQPDAAKTGAQIVTSVDAVDPIAFSTTRTRRPPTISRGPAANTPKTPTVNRPMYPRTPGQPSTPVPNQGIPPVSNPNTPPVQPQMVMGQNGQYVPVQQPMPVPVPVSGGPNPVVPNPNTPPQMVLDQNGQYVPVQQHLSAANQPNQFPYHYFYNQPTGNLPRYPRTGYRMYRSPTKRRSRATSPIYPLTTSPFYPTNYNTMVTPTSGTVSANVTSGNTTTISPVNTGGVVMNTPQVVINTPQILLNTSSRKNVLDAWNQFQSFSDTDPSLAPEAQNLKRILAEFGLIQ
uniref:Uncharacterized protein n=1 Tax=Clandestinovirus TaxID=2831644 RepID=A0A8F8PKJ9_9VIRU|nr:hypothetical protein KOM_12_578 [Clandestinovirus]